MMKIIIKQTRINERSWTFSNTNKSYNARWLIENIKNY